MPELTRHTVRVCDTNLYWSYDYESPDSGKHYTVRFEATPEGPYQYGLTCTCPAFKYNKSEPCKHIEAVKDERCAWNATCEITRKVRKCPKCKGPVTSIEVAV